MSKTKSNIRNIVSIIIILILGIAASITSILNSYKENTTKAYNPILTDSPIYIEMSDGDSLEVILEMKEDVLVSGISSLILHTQKDGEGELELQVKSGDGTLISSAVIQEKDIEVGTWNIFPVNAKLNQCDIYGITLTAKNCSPYIMYVPDAGMKLMPCYETVLLNGTDQEKCVAIGLVEDAPFSLNSTNIFVLIMSLILMVAAVLVNKLGLENTISAVENHLNDERRFILLIKMLLSDLVLIIVFIYLCTNIYSEGFKNGIYITSDSAGYLREAVNMKAGNGFSYDGLAGYTSWFASWPILYPFMIFITMVITGQDSYIASKILTCILLFFILLVLRLRFKNKAYIYSIALLNLGFVTLSFYTWSEIPFILFLLLFGFKLGDLVDEEKKNKIWDYILLGLYGFLTFLTRYFGIYVWVVAGIYVLSYAIKFIKKKDKEELFKAVKLSVCAFVSGMLSIGYMMINKLVNGYASGVSRSDWWDDYSELTKDLIDSLTTEIFNVFHIDISSFVKDANYPLKVVFILIVVGLIILFIKKRTRFYSKNMALLILGGVYYGMFIVIRYFSSMDTFYFRFFEPASFILTIGIVGVLIKTVKLKKNITKAAYGLAVAFVLILTLFGITKSATKGLCGSDYDYYEIAKAEWDKSYTEVPQKSVVIFSDLDFRSEYYRPDVIKGEILPEDSLEDINSRYYGSDSLVIQKEYAKTMVESNAYTKEITEFLENGLVNNPNAKKYISIQLH